MKLNSLEIKKPYSFGRKEGDPDPEYECTINIGDDKGTIDLKLGAEVGDAILLLAIDEIDKATRTACDDFRDRLFASVGRKRLPEHTPEPVIDAVKETAEEPPPTEKNGLSRIFRKRPGKGGA